MSLRINQNVTSLATYSSLNKTSKKMEKSISKLSSGLRINTAADDAAGLAISEKMRSQIKGLNRAKLNAQDGVSMLQTAESGLNETESMIQRMRELAIQASNDTLTPNDRLEIQKEVTQLRDAIDDIAYSTEFNTKKLLNGSQTGLLSSSSKYITGLATGGDVIGGDYSVSMTVLQGGISQMQKTQIMRDKNTGELAKGNTKLEDIEQFYDENGVFALTSQQTLTLTGNSDTTEIVVDGKMTLNELASSLQNALAGTSNLNIRNTQVEVINTATTGISGLGGYIQFTSGAVGDQGEFAIHGDQALLDALGVSITRESENNIVDLRIESANGNVREIKTSSNRAVGLLDGMDIMFDSVPAQVAGAGGIVDGIHFTAQHQFTFAFNPDGNGLQNVTVVFHSGNYSLENIARTINHFIDITPGAMNSGCEASVVDGHIRLAFNPTHDEAPTDIEVISGSDTLGIIQGSYVGFVDGENNPENCIKGISILDETLPAENTSGATLSWKVTDGQNRNVTISLGNRVGIVYPDLLESRELTISCNNIFANASANARFDVVNDSIAFTSTILGDYNNNSNGSVPSQLIVSSSNSFLNDSLSYKDGTKLGLGDTNYRVRVVDTRPDFQIGANAGQQMGVTIADMSAKALGIDRLDMSTSAGAQEAIEKLDQALATVSAERSKLGAYNNRLQHTMNNLDNTATNLTDSESRIRDVDMASEMINFTSSQIMNQAGTAMLAQANAMGQSVLSLLR